MLASTQCSFGGGVSAFAGADPQYGSPFKNNCFGIHGLVTYALLACGLVIVCVKFWRFHVSNVMLLMLAFDAIAGLVVNAVFVQEM